jgi:hypothetical protein
MQCMVPFIWSVVAHMLALHDHVVIASFENLGNPIKIAIPSGMIIRLLSLFSV